jgi:hypothetical protein
MAIASGGLALAAPSSAVLARAAGSACGASTQATVAAVDAAATTDIYGNELAGTEVSLDLAQIAGSAELLNAVAADSRSATLTAVKHIVYHPSWHIVRLRVLNTYGQLLADFGGPYVIAPVSGVLRSATGTVIGSFVMSVQDDVGVTKLETRFVGDPIGIYLRGRRVAERGASFPAAVPRGASVTLGGVDYHPVIETYKAFPSGTLSAVILVAPPPASLTAEPCATVRAQEFGRVAERLTNLLGPLAQHYSGYSTWVRIYTGAEVFVRSGATQLASAGGTGPAVLPTSGTVSYQGTTWLVFSFQPFASTRVYLLIPPS